MIFISSLPYKDSDDKKNNQSNNKPLSLSSSSRGKKKNFDFPRDRIKRTWMQVVAWDNKATAVRRISSFSSMGSTREP